MTRSRFDGKEIRNLIEMTEDPVEKLAKQLKNSSAMQAARMRELHDVNNLIIESAQQAKIAFEAQAKSPQWAEFSASIEVARRTLARAETFAALQSTALQRIEQHLRNCVLATNSPVLPTAKALRALSASAARAIQPPQVAEIERWHSSMKALRALSANAARAIQPPQVAEIERWHSSIKQRMETLTAPWAMKDHLGVSVVGFSRIARLHDLSTGAEPFAPQTAEVFDEELGQPVSLATDGEPEDRESAAMDAGLNPEIIAFPARAYPRVLFSAGFEFSIERIQDVQSDSGDKSGVFDPQYSVLLQQVEHHLRMTVETKLLELAGERWYKLRVPGPTCQRWQERKEEDYRRRNDSFPLILYADFTDLSEIICRKDNWKDVFHPLFVSKDDLQVSLQRLIPIRNAIAHNRPLVRTDQITLFSEACRILTALGVRF